MSIPEPIKGPELAMYLRELVEKLEKEADEVTTFGVERDSDSLSYIIRLEWVLNKRYEDIK